MFNSNSNKKSTGGNSSGNKSKKSKTDILRQAVGIHLKNKCYVGNEKYRKSDFVLQQNKKQFSVQKMLDNDLHCGNFFTFSLVSPNNQHLVDQQFGRFTQFVESQTSEFLRNELKRFYGPMICHQYLDFLKAQETKVAGEFLKKYANVIGPVDTYDAPLPLKINGCTLSNDVHGTGTDAAANAVVNNTGCAGAGVGAGTFTLNIRYARDANPNEDFELDFFIKLIQTLSTCTKLESAEEIMDVALFRASKYEIHTTETVVEALNAYLEKRGHVVLFNLIYTWIHLQIIDNEIYSLTEESLFFGPDEDYIEMYEQKPKIVTIKSEKVSTKRTVSATSEEVTPIVATMEPVVKEEIKTEENCDTKEQKQQTVEMNARLCVESLQKYKDQIFDIQTDFPRFIKISDKNKGLTSADLDENECHLVAGFNNSIVHLWQLNQHNTYGKNIYNARKESNCCWQLNNCVQEEEDVIENDVKRHTDKEDKHLTWLQNKYYEKKFEGNSYNDYGCIELRGHSLGVTDVRFSAFNSLIYSVSKDNTIRTWRADNYACAAVYHGHNYAIWCIDESPVGMYMATGSKDLTARLWSLERQYPLITYVGHTQDVECISFHPNGNYVATGSSDNSVRLWCVTSGKLMRVFCDCKQSVSCLAFSPDGKFLAAAGEETKIRIFDLAAGAQLHELKDHTASVASIAWQPNGQHLTSVCRDGTFRLWDVKKLSLTHESGSSTTTTAATAATTTTTSTTSSSSTTASTSTSSSSSTTATTTTNRLLAFSGNCQTFVKVFYSANETICAIGS